MNYIIISTLLGLFTLSVIFLVWLWRNGRSGTAGQTASHLQQIQLAKDLVKIELCALTAQEAIIKALVEAECDDLNVEVFFRNDRSDLSFPEVARQRVEQKCYDFDNKSNKCEKGVT